MFLTTTARLCNIHSSSTTNRYQGQGGSGEGLVGEGGAADGQ